MRACTHTYVDAPLQEAAEGMIRAGAGHARALRNRSALGCADAVYWSLSASVHRTTTSALPLR